MSVVATKSAMAGELEVRATIQASGDLVLTLPEGRRRWRYASPQEAELAATREVRMLAERTGRCCVLRVDKTVTICITTSHNPKRHEGSQVMSDAALERILGGAAAAMVKAHDLVLHAETMRDPDLATDIAEIALTIEELRSQRLEVALSPVRTPAEAVGLALEWLESIEPTERPLWFVPLQSELATMQRILA